MTSESGRKSGLTLKVRPHRFGIVGVVAIANAAWEIFHPPAFRIDLTGDTLSFEFGDKAQAEEFAAANGMSFERQSPA